MSGKRSAWNGNQQPSLTELYKRSYELKCDMFHFF
ncbi:hypothetical protein HNR53_000113 [Bacillus benzoevorans]|uniref:Uncharacterized protein n=1 Tax=Bacillus benzoevorans TaxID=1456 RepID=A0A7X0HQ13_9BACI|nr:hypothetical protein [Bacillus benzoevorans]